MRLQHSMCVCVIVLLFLGGALFAQEQEEDKIDARQGITSGFAKVKVENLRPGRTYRVSKLYAPVSVFNASELDIHLEMELFKPQPQGLTPGFEPIPSLKWVLLEKTSFYLLAFETAESDFILHIPDEPAQWGKKYQLGIWSHTIAKPEAGKSGLGVGLAHIFLFTTLPLEKRGEDFGGEEPKESSYFTMKPFEIFMSTVNMHDTINVAERSGQKLVLENPHPKPHRFRVRVLRPDEWEGKPHKWYEPCPYPEWLKFKETEFVVDAESSKQIEMKLTIEPALSYRGKKYLFVVRTEILDGEIPTSLDTWIYIDISQKFKREWLYQ